MAWRLFIRSSKETGPGGPCGEWPCRTSRSRRPTPICCARSRALLPHGCLSGRFAGGRSGADARRRRSTSAPRRVPRGGHGHGSAGAAQRLSRVGPADPGRTDRACALDARARHGLPIAFLAGSGSKPPRPSPARVSRAFRPRQPARQALTAIGPCKAGGQELPTRRLTFRATRRSVPAIVSRRSIRFPPGSGPGDPGGESSVGDRSDPRAEPVRQLGNGSAPTA